jgi:hypothetical protein
LQEVPGLGDGNRADPSPWVLTVTKVTVTTLLAVA